MELLRQKGLHTERKKKERKEVQKRREKRSEAKRREEKNGKERNGTNRTEQFTLFGDHNGSLGAPGSPELDYTK